MKSYRKILYFASIIPLFLLVSGCTSLVNSPESTIKQQVSAIYGSGFHSFQFKLVEQQENRAMYIVQFKEAKAGGPTRVYVAQAIVSGNSGSWECTNLIFPGGSEPKRAFPW